jgi:hypothetical protein
MFKFLPLIAAALIALSATAGIAQAQTSNPFAQAASKAAWVIIEPACSPATAGCSIIPTTMRSRA